jgi:hypothetical protein
MPTPTLDPHDLDGAATAGSSAVRSGAWLGSVGLERRVEPGESSGLVGVGGVRPYYAAGGISIFHGDCRHIMPLLAPCDLLLTDPPYGIKADRTMSKQGGTQTGKSIAPKRHYAASGWDDEPVEDWALALARRLCRSQIIFGGNYYTLPPARCWLVWDKENGDNGYADCELAWTNLDKAVRRLKHQWHGMLRKDGEDRWHPTQKPLDVMSWALRQAPPEVVTVLDPWMGSGTSLRAAKDHGKQGIGIEREERWCEIAAKRMEQECLPLGGGGAEPVRERVGDTAEKLPNHVIPEE